LVRDLIEDWRFSSSGGNVELEESNFVVVGRKSGDEVELGPSEELEVFQDESLAILLEVFSGVVNLECLLAKTASLWANAIREIREGSDGFQSPDFEGVLSSLQVVE